MRSFGLFLSALILSTLLLLSCQRTPHMVDPKAPLEATFTFLPQKHSRTIIVMHDSIVVLRKSPGDTILSRRALALSDSSRGLRDSLYAQFGRIAPKTYTREGVLDGTIIRIGQPGRSIECRNCLNDYVLQAGGKKKAWSDESTTAIRSVVVLLNRLAAFDDIASRPKRDRVVIEAIRPDASGKAGSFTVKYLDRPQH